ncbi:MAG: glutamate 5-kinase [Actinobacteria bacterium]|nr:glutamate 5-kinase [Actinomycetota bacterium]
MSRFPTPALAVVKVGSSSLRGEDGRLDREQVRSISEQVVMARGRGTRVVLVSSGAVAAGMGLLGLDRRPDDLPTLQAAAAVGQGELIHEYQRHLAGHGVAAAQILLSQDDFVRRQRYLNARTTLRRLLELRTIPIINENDAIATEELSYGDNDHLAALVTSMLDAQLLLMLSDVPGLFDRDPRQNDEAQLVHEVPDVGSLDPLSVGGTGSHLGSGGMRTKVESARVAAFSGAHAVVAAAREPEVVPRALQGESVGTWFHAQPRRGDARKLWIGFALNLHGRIHVDAGAARALTERNTSLLAVGVTGVDGSFSAGDAVEVVDPEGHAVARGLVNYDVGDVAKLAGRSTSAAVDEFGPGFAREVIHRDDLVLVGGARD